MSNYQESFERRAIAARYWLLAMIGTSQNAAEYNAALSIMEMSMAHHNGKRNGGAPEFVHQVSIFHHIRTFHHLLGTDAPLYYILAFTHDIIEDGQKQDDGTVKFMPLVEVANVMRTSGMEETRVAYVIDLLKTLSKEILGQKNPDYSLEQIFANKITFVVKLADRCDNVSTMMGVFKKERAQRYVKETKEKFVVLAKGARRSFPELEAVFENMKMFLDAQLRLIDQMMPGYTDPVRNSTTQQEALNPPGPPRVKVTAILAAGPGGVIGRADGSLFVNCKHDMQFFKEQTHGHNVVMGRNTFESLPGAKGPGAPLPNRHIIVVTGNKAKNGYSGFGYEYVYVDPTLSTSALIELLKSRMRKTAHMDRLIIAGGAYVYNRLLENGDVDEVMYSEYGGDRMIQEVKNTDRAVCTNYDSAHDLFNALNDIGTWTMEVGPKDEVQVTSAYNKTSFNADYQLFKMTKETQ